MDNLTINTRLRHKNGATEIFSILFAFFFPSIHSLMAYFLLSSDSNIQKYVTTISQIMLQPFVYHMIQIISLLLNFFLVPGSVNTLHKIEVLIQFPFFERLMQKYQILVQINLILCFMLGLLQLRDNLALMIISSTLAIFKNIFIQNYHYRKQKNYQLSSQISLYFKIAQILTINANCFVVAISSFDLFVTCSMLSGIFGLLWNIHRGFKLFKNQSLQLIIHFLTATTISQSLQFFLIFWNSQSFRSFNIAQWTIEMAVLITFFIANEYRWINDCIQHFSDKTDLKIYQSVLYNISSQIDNNLNKNQDKLCLLLGVLKQHMLNGCLNPECLLRGEAPSEISTISLFKKKEYILKLHFKCLYQSAIMKEKTSKNMINYCDFMMLEFGNFSKHCLYLQQLLSSRRLGLLQKIKVQHLKRILKEQSENLNRKIFGDIVELIDVFDSETHHHFILDNIHRFCQESINIWNQMNAAIIDKDSIKIKIIQIFSILPQIDKRWKKLSKYFQMQKQWKFIYLSYKLFLKNEEITSKTLSSLCDIGLKDKKNKILNDNCPEGLNQLTYQNQIFLQNARMLYVCEFKNNQLIIVNINQEFLDFMDYEKDQITYSPLNIILPSKLREKHNNLIQNWLEKCLSVDQTLYFAKFSHIVNKYDQQTPVIAMFSLFVNYSTQGNLIQFLGFIKILKQRDISSLDGVIKNKYDLFQSLMPPLPQLESSKVRLISQNNIFFKQNYRLNNKHSSISNIHITFIITILCLIIIIVSMIHTINRFNVQACLKGDQELFFINLYRFPMALVKNQYKMILGIGNKATASSQISQATATLALYQSNILTIQTLSDRTLNIPKTYGPFNNNTFNRGIQYNQIDLFYVVYSSIISLSKEKSINRNGTNFKQLNSYLKPAYDEMINITKLNFHVALQNILNQMFSYHLELIIGQACVICFLTVYLFVVYFNYHKKMKELFMIILSFSNKDIKISIDYWQKVIDVFEIVNIANKNGREQKKEVLISKGITRINSSFIMKNTQKGQNNKDKNIHIASLNKQFKNITSSHQDKRQVCKIIISVLIISNFIFITATAIYITNLAQLKSIIEFEKQGFQLLQHFPITTNLGYALMDQCYSRTYPQQYTFELSRFQDTLSSLKIITEYNYSNQFNLDSKYNIQFKNYFFGNPCTYNPTVLIAANSTQAKCLPILASGISPYLRTVHPQINSYLNGKLNMTPSEVDTLTSGLTLTSYYISDALQTWESEFKAKMIRFASQNQTLLPLMCMILILIYFFGVKLWIMPILKRKFKFKTALFQSFVPENILRRQKMTNQLFSNAGILSID